MAAVVRAAGGVLERDGLIAVVHRPRYDDWTLPKGKLTRGEHPLAGACREVEEETGVRPVARPWLTSVEYEVSGAPKHVDYWVMRAGEEVGFTPGSEVDDVGWFDAEQTRAILSYERDLTVLSAYERLPAVTSMVALIRHATAGRRSAWPGPDDARPLDPAGIAQASALAGLLCWYSPHLLVSAPARRCLQTLAPLAERLDAPIEVETVFAEDAAPAAAAERIRELAKERESIVVSSHGGLIGPALAALAPGPYSTPKGTGWVLAFSGDAVVSVEPLIPLDPSADR